MNHLGADGFFCCIFDNLITQVALLRLHFNISSSSSSSSSSDFDGVIDARLFDDVCIMKSILSNTR